jgi:heptosyltransferase-2
MERQFLVIQTAFLGDAVLATAVLEQLHALYPDAAIDLVVRKGNEGLFTGHPFLRTVHVWDKGTGKTRALFDLVRKLRTVRYDQIINAQRYFSTGLMTVLARGAERTGYDKNPMSRLFTRRIPHVIGDGRHEVHRLLALTAHLGGAPTAVPRLYPTEKDRAQARAAKDPSTKAYVTIAPASVWGTKEWPAHKWAALIQALPADRGVYLIGAPGDVGLCTRIAHEAGRGTVLAGRLSLLGTAALMEGAVMNYVNDSAPMHIASAMHAPVTAVFCSTVPSFGFGPVHANGRVAETREPLTCRPCGLHGHRSCPLGHFRCAESIPVEDVV